MAAFAQGFNDDGIWGSVGGSEGRGVDDSGVAGEQGPANAGVAGAYSGENAPWGDGAQGDDRVEWGGGVGAEG